MAMIGRNAAVAEVGKHHHQVEGPVAFAAWLGVHAMLLSGVHSKTDAFITWAWDYFDRDHAATIEASAATPERLAWADHGEDMPHIVLDRPQEADSHQHRNRLRTPEPTTWRRGREPGRQPGRAGPGHHPGDLPAASTIFTGPTEYDLSNTQYGAMFLPQVVTAIVASLLGAWLARRFGSKRVYWSASPPTSSAMVAAGHQPALRDRHGARVPPAAGRDRVPRRRLRPDRAGVEHLCGRVPAGARRPRCARPQRTARARHCAGAGLRGGLRRAWASGGACPCCRRVLLRPAAARQRSATPARRRPRPPARPAGSAPGSRRGSGCSPGSPSCTASARR